MNNKAAKGTWAAAFTVGSVWFGTHVGGGFASGNQVVSYFSQYGIWAAVLPIIAMGILALVMYTVMKFAKLSGFTNYKDTFSALYPKPWMEVFFEIFYIVILLAAVAAAVAGAGEVLANFFGVDYSVTANKLIFNLIIVAVLIILSIFGVKLVIAASTVLSIAILISTAVVVVAGFAADFDAISAQLLAEETRGEQTGLIDEMIGNQKVVQAFGRGKDVTERFDEINERLRDASLRATFFSSITNPGTRFVNSLVYTGVGIAGAFAVVNGSLSVGQLSSFLFVIFKMHLRGFS